MLLASLVAVQDIGASQAVARKRKRMHGSESDDEEEPDKTPYAFGVRIWYHADDKSSEIERGR